MIASLWVRCVALGLVGAATAWSQAPASFWPLLLLGPPLAWAAWRSADTGLGAAALGWAFGVGYFAAGLNWIGHAFLVDPAHAWMRPFAVALLPTGLALFWALAFWAAKTLAQAWRLRGPVAPAVFVVAWALAEFARGHVLTGFPWGLFAFAWIETPVAQLAAWIGPYGLNALTLAAGVFVGEAVLNRAAGWRALAPIPITLAALAAAWGAGAARLPEGPAPNAGGLVRLVQPNVPQSEKWDLRYLQRNVGWLRELTQARTDGPAPELVVWPEAAVVPTAIADPAAREVIASWTPNEAPLIVGTQRIERDGEEVDYFNSLFVVTGTGEISAVYDKHHLVPFGEYLPLNDLMRAIGVAQLAGRDQGFSAGPGPTTLRPDGVPTFGALICYEAIFPQGMPGLADRPEVLIQVTNDAWFGDSGGPHQHLAQARMRAIEQGLPFLRSANTGVSAAIDPYGRVTASLGLGERGFIDVARAAALPPTLYARYGEAGFLLILGLFLVLMLIRPASTSQERTMAS